ncbi:MAG: hypothetical protein ABI270_03530 [Nitrosospira sp.]
MNNAEDKSGDEAIESNKQVLTLTLDELRRSHSILENVMAWLPLDTRKEFVELLRILAGHGESQESFDLVRQKALQLIIEACMQDHVYKKITYKPEQITHKPERRAGERRQFDRRQQARNFGKPWTVEQVKILQTLIGQNIPTRQIALKLGRTSTAIQLKTRELNARD